MLKDDGSISENVKACITSLDLAAAALEGKAGTWISNK